MSDLTPDEVLAIVIGALVVVDIVFGIVSARVASGKGRSAELGFLTGFLLNVLGLIIVMLMRPSVEAEARRRVEVERAYERRRRFGDTQVDEVAQTSERETKPESRPWQRGVDDVAQKNEHETDTVTIQRRLDGATVTLAVPVVVLSTPALRASGLNVLADKRTVCVLYVWPKSSRRSRRFLNPTATLEVTIVTLADNGKIEEIRHLRQGAYWETFSKRVTFSAIAVLRERFDELGLEVDDTVVVSEDLRLRAR